MDRIKKEYGWKKERTWMEGRKKEHGWKEDRGVERRKMMDAKKIEGKRWTERRMKTEGKNWIKTNRRKKNEDGKKKERR